MFIRKERPADVYNPDILFFILCAGVMIIMATDDISIK